MTDFTQLDPQVVTLAKAIRQVESGGNFNAVGDSGHSFGAYQWYDPKGDGKAHFASDAKSFGLDPTDLSPTNQDKVAYAKMKAWKDKGYHAGEIAAMWNGSHLENGRPVPNNPQYVVKVQSALGQSNGQETSPPTSSGLDLNGVTTDYPGSGVNNLPTVQGPNEPTAGGGPSAKVPLKQQAQDASMGLIKRAPSVFGLPEGLATTARVVTSTLAPNYAANSNAAITGGDINQTGDEIGKSFDREQAVRNAIHKLPIGSPERKKLIEYLKRQQTGNADPGYHDPSQAGDGVITQEEIDPGTKLTNAQVAKSAALTAAAAIAGPKLIEKGGGLTTRATAAGGLLSKALATSKTGATLYGAYQLAKHSPAKGLLKVAGHFLE